MENFLRDLKFGLRVVRKRPVVTLAGVFCLALGIGAATIVFSLVKSVLLNPLPIEKAEDVVYVYTQFSKLGVVNGQVSPKEYNDIKEMSRSFEQVEAMMPWYFNITSGDAVRRRIGARISPGLFPMLGVEPAIGRNFTAEEADQEATTAIISHKMWERTYASDPDILNQTISLEGVPYDIVGVMPKSFFFQFEGASLWVPWRANLRWPRHLRLTLAVARLSEDATPETVQQDLTSVAQLMQQDNPDTYAEDSGWGLSALSVREDLLGDTDKQLEILMAAVMLVLFIACMNVANLLLVQAAKREREIGMRAALGAKPRDLVRQLLVESSILALLGCALGLVFAFVGSKAVLQWGLSLPRVETTSIDWWVLAFAVGVSLLTGILFGLVPALRATKVDLYEVLREGARAGESGAKQMIRRLLVIAEVSLAVLVLIGAGLMIRTFDALDAVDPGFNTDSVVSAELFLSPKSYPGTGEERRALYRSVLNELKNRPEIQKSAITTMMPLTPLDQNGIVSVEGRQATPGNPDPSASWRMVSPDFFDVMDIPLLKGREFTDLDHETSLPVVILDASLAEKLFPDESPLDKRIRLERDPNLDGDGWRTVVGVVETLRDDSLVGEDNALLYVPYLQFPFTIVTVVGETQLDDQQFRSVVQESLRKVDPGMPVALVRSTADILASSKSSAEFNRQLFGLFGIAVLLLVGVGVYGVMAYSVAQRTQEIGLRVALGAEPKKVLTMVLRQGLALGSVGLVIGFMLVFLLSASDFIKSYLDGMLQGVVEIVDPATFISVFAVLVFLVLLGTFVPAFRATRVDPLTALKEE